MNLSQDNLKAARELLCGAPLRVVVVSHTNPDGDAIGSSLALREALVAQGHDVTCIVPNRFPYYLDWIPNIKHLLIFKSDRDAAIEAVRDAEVIICADMSMLSRLDELGEVIASNTAAKRVLVDHHLNPDPTFDVMFSHPESSSTAFLVYCIIVELFGKEAITPTMAEQLYVGMMTDTGNFSFSFLTPELFRAVADLSETGINIPQIYNNVYNSFTESRARLFGYVINRKMKTLHKGTVAYMSLTEEEMRRFWFQQGDSEGFVNYPLTVKKMKMSAIFIEHHDFIRVSLRSRGNVDVNEFANRYFNGGGHKNAAGGKSFVSMEETIAHYIASVKEFVEEGGLSKKD
ncbi:MAG: bifunctional oligoribonuclease/PAP phosphatase NrnA [Alistipes sp.]|nr:bifunctional oligoribonuclease/PAP phosphatase NrnA [Alistipes sp.]